MASETFFEDKLDEIAKLAPPSKMVVGFGNYGYDWPIGGSGGREVTFDDVMAAASGSQGTIDWNATAENPVLRFTASGQQHEVWFLDAVTALNQITAVHDTRFPRRGSVAAGRGRSGALEGAAARSLAGR